MTDPVALRRLVVAVQLRNHTPDPDPQCVPGEICVYPCDEPTQCHKCDMLLTAALYRLAEIGTVAALENMASLAVDPRMDWDAGRGLTISDAAAQMGRPILPYLAPYVRTSTTARRIVDCIERQRRCL